MNECILLRSVAMLPSLSHLSEAASPFVRFGVGGGVRWCSADSGQWEGDHRILCVALFLSSFVVIACLARCLRLCSALISLSPLGSICGSRHGHGGGGGAATAVGETAAAAATAITTTTTSSNTVVNIATASSSMLDVDTLHRAGRRCHGHGRDRYHFSRELFSNLLNSI